MEIPKMPIKKLFPLFILFILTVSFTFGQPRLTSSSNTAWEQLLQHSPSAVDDPGISWKERLALYILSPDQAENYYRGADPDTIFLENGETLKQYLDRKMSPRGSLYYSLRSPCTIFEVEEDLVQGIPFSLNARGEDLSRQGGSGSGCSIPEDATSIMIRLEISSEAGLSPRLKLWSSDSPEPVDTLLDGKFSGMQPASTLTIVPLSLDWAYQDGDFQLLTSERVKIRGQVFGYFKNSNFSQFAKSSGSWEGRCTSIPGRSAPESDPNGPGRESSSSPARSKDTSFLRLDPSARDWQSLDTAIEGDLFVNGGACIGCSEATHSVSNGDLNVSSGLCVNCELTASTEDGVIRIQNNAPYLELSTDRFQGKSWFIRNSAGGEYFEITDKGTPFDRVPIRIQNGASSNSFFLNSEGNLGLGTSIPKAELHITGKGEFKSPSILLEVLGDTIKDSYSWEVGSDFRGFSIRDTTAGRTPFTIASGSPSGSFRVNTDGSVGIGTTIPDSPLHVLSKSTLARVIVAEHAGSEAARNMMNLKNNGITQFRLIDTSPDGDAWQFSNTDSGLNISLQGSGSQEFLIQDDGDVWINNGTIMVTSYRASKKNFRELDSQEILRRVADLPLSDWNYKKDADTVRHIGPVSEDFYDAFGYGEDDQHISPNDLAGVAIAAAQGLFEQVKEKDRRIESMRLEMDLLKQEMVEIKQMLRSLAGN
jgi:hypothetical protein